MLVATKSSDRDVRRRELRPLAIAMAVFLLAGCGSLGRPSSSDTGSSSSDAALAARGRASLVATFTDTPWRLPPVHSPDCEKKRQSTRTTRNSNDFYEDSVFCSLNRSAMIHLLRRLDQGLGTEATDAEKSCINQKITRDQVAALLTAEKGVGRDRVATVTEFDHQLVAAIQQCTSN